MRTTNDAHHDVSRLARSATVQLACRFVVGTLALSTLTPILAVEFNTYTRYNATRIGLPLQASTRSLGVGTSTIQWPR
jgi:hypothetical protein